MADDQFDIQTSGTDEEQVSASVQTQDGGEYSTRGKTVLATRPGHAFAPSDKSLPVVTSNGVTFTRDTADNLLEEASVFGTGYLREVNSEA